MRISIAYPPLPSSKGSPLLSQNRQFQWFKNPTFIYPIVPAYAATFLKKAGHEVFWLDGIAQRWDYSRWLREIKKIKPDLIMMETKTPVIKSHWKVIDDLKNLRIESGGVRRKLETVLVGDHVTALPEESFQKSKVDYILTGGDYDFLLLNLVNYLSGKAKLEEGIYYKNGKKIKNTGRFVLNHNLNSLPLIDRNLTKWWLYSRASGNYKRTPGTYIMAGRDCWWRSRGGCKFCAWTVLYPKYRVREPDNVLDEIGMLIDKYGIREIMDDTGSFPIGDWLHKFCHGMIERGYHKKIYFSCNLRAGALKQKDYDLMAKAGFRMLLYGLESANQKTLELINKGIKRGAIEKDCRMAKIANQKAQGRLEPHLTIMVGYPWETEKEALNTVKLGRELLEKGLADTLQATVVIPYPGTALFKECQQKNLLKSVDWDDYDMSKPIMKTTIEDEKLLTMVQSLYKVAFSPRFIYKKIISIHSLDDLKYILRGGRAIFGHLSDFSRKS